MFQKKSTYMLEGSPLWSMVFFAMPMIIGNLFQQFYNMADSAIVGKFVSENALAAVGASYSLTNVFICIAIGGGVGSSVSVSYTHLLLKRESWPAEILYLCISWY